MSVPLLDLKLQHDALESELAAAFTRVLRSGHYILGPEVESCERQFAEYLQVRHAITVSSGTDAVLLALMALGIKPGDEVLCPSFTFFATAGCVARVGAKPVFVDSCPICFNINPADAASGVTRKTKAIIPVHLFGQAVAMDAVLALAREHGLATIEDAAQSLGARRGGRFAGTMGAFGCYSFFPTKNLGCLGDGGLLVTNDDALAEQATLLRTHGAKPKYHHKHVGGNFRMDALQAAFLRVKLPRLDSYARRRSENAAHYTEKLSKLRGAVINSAKPCVCAGNRSVKSDLPPDVQLALPAVAPENEHVWNQYTLRVLGAGRRDALRQFLATKGIGSEIYYPIPLHRQECFTSGGVAMPDLPLADRLSRECLSIPIFPELRRAQQDEVIGVIAEFLEDGSADGELN